MTAQPTPDRTHIWDGTRSIPDWLAAGTHHWDGRQLVIHTPDGEARPQPGWMLVHWSDATVTIASPRIAERVYGPTGRVEQLATALQEALDCITFGLGQPDPGDYDRWRAVLAQPNSRDT